MKGSYRAILLVVALAFFVTGCGDTVVTDPHNTPGITPEASLDVKATVTAAVATALAAETEESPTPPEPSPTLTPSKAEPSLIWHEVIDDYCIGEDRVFIYENKGKVRALNPSTGQELWRWEGQWETGGAIIECDSEAVYLGRADERLYALDASSGQERWKLTLVRMISAWDLRREGQRQDEERLYVEFTELDGSNHPDHLVATIDKNAGSLLWSHRIENGTVSESYLLGLRGNELLIYGNQGVQSLDVNTGLSQWESNETCYCHGNEIVSGDVLFCIEGWRAHGPLKALALETGQKLWQTEEDDLEIIGPVTSELVYATDGAHLHVYDRTTGAEVWSRPAREQENRKRKSFPGEFNGRAILNDRSLGFTWALDPRTGQVIWENDDLVLEYIAGVHQGVLIGLRASTQQRGRSSLYGVDCETGETLWRTEVPGIHPVLRDGKVFAFKGNGLFIYDAVTGEHISTVESPAEDLEALIFVEDTTLIYGVTRVWNVKTEELMAVRY